MIYIYCGQNTVQSRRSYLSKREELMAQNCDLIELTQDNLDELANWLYTSVPLFEKKRGFYGEGLLSKKEHRNILKQLCEDESFLTVLYEEKIEARDIKKYFPKGNIINAKLPHSIFTFLDCIQPNNLHTAIAQLQSVSQVVDEHMILYMLTRRIKELILAKDGVSLPRTATWQFGKIKSQASKWDEKTLLSFYDKLNAVERGIKTSNTPYTSVQSMEILFCFYMR